MAQVINTNVPSLNAQRNLTKSQGSLATTLQRLSTGLRINSAKDDAAGLAISERFTSQIRGVNQAARNANDGISLVQTAEAVLNSATDILQRMRELSVQSANATNTSSDRQALQDEVNQLNLELDRIARDSEFNGQKLFDGTFSAARFQVGANSYQTVSIGNTNLRTNKYGNNLIMSSGAETSIMNPAVWGSNGVASGTAVIAGYLGKAPVNIVGYTAGPPTVFADTAQTIANKINVVSAETGVSADARTELQLTFDAPGSYSMELTSENVKNSYTPPLEQPINITFTLLAKDGINALSAAAAAINNISAKTGITAEVSKDGSNILLANQNGSDIMMTLNGAPDAGAVNVQKMHRDQYGDLQPADPTSQPLTEVGETAIVSGYVQLDSTQGFFIDTEDADNPNPNADFNVLADDASVMNLVSEIDVTSFETATKSIKTADAGIAFIAAQRSLLGAVQSRFEAMVQNLMSASEGMSAARSRIQDADFAAETAALTRAQILQQAGISMLSQANTMPQNTLKLLQ